MARARLQNVRLLEMDAAALKFAQARGYSDRNPADPLDPKDLDIALASEEIIVRLGNQRRHLEHALAAEWTKPLYKDAVFVQRRDYGQIEFLAQRKVLGTTARSDVNQPGAFRFAHILPKDHSMCPGGTRRHHYDRRGTSQDSERGVSKSIYHD